MIDNPDYKGEWSPKQIDNPAYKGTWVHPEIPNPDYKPDPELYYRKEICAIGLDLWQVNIEKNIFWIVVNLLLKNLLILLFAELTFALNDVNYR